MASIAETVFAVTELLEIILLEVPMKDVLVHQRTCKAVRNTVAGSEALKKKLFLLPTGPTIDPIDENAEGQDWSLSCLTYPSVHVKLNPAVLVERGEWSPHHNDEEHRPSYALKTWPPAVVSVDLFYGAVSWKIQMHVTPGKRQSWSRGVFKEGASWRNMFLTQPPISAISFCNDYVEAISSAVGSWELNEPFVTIWNPTGLRLGDLHEEVTDLQNRYPNPEPFERDDCSLQACSNCGGNGYNLEDSLTRVIAGCKGVLGRDGSCECMTSLWREDLPEPSEEMGTLLRLCKREPES